MSLEAFHVQKVIDAIGKSAYRALTKFTPEERNRSVNASFLIDALESTGTHLCHAQYRGKCLEQVRYRNQKCYRDYRNYKQDFVRMLDVQKARRSYVGDKENSNADSAHWSLQKRSLIFNQLNKEALPEVLPDDRRDPGMQDGYIYIHDMSARRDTMNCCLFDVAHALRQLRDGEYLVQ